MPSTNWLFLPLHRAIQCSAFHHCILLLNPVRKFLTLCLPIRSVSKPHYRWTAMNKSIPLTLMSRNPVLVSRPAKGFAPLAPALPSRASRSILPAHTLQLIGFSGSAPSTIPAHISATATRHSMVMSKGRAVEMGVEDEAVAAWGATELRREACS